MHLLEEKCITLCYVLLFRIYSKTAEQRTRTAGRIKQRREEHFSKKLSSFFVGNQVQNNAVGVMVVGLDYSIDTSHIVYLTAALYRTIRLLSSNWIDFLLRISVLQHEAEMLLFLAFSIYSPCTNIFTVPFPIPRVRRFPCI